MNVGFYYHVEGVFDDEYTASIPSYLGVFVQELAKQAGHVTLYLHGAIGSASQDLRGGPADYRLAPPTVRCIDLGPRRSAAARSFLPRPDIQRFHPQDDGLDVMLIRGPTPLLPHLVRAATGVPVALLFVGRYTVRSRRPGTTLLRRLLIRTWVRFYEMQQRKAAQQTLILANSPELSEFLKQRFGQKVREVFTSSLTEEMVGAVAMSPRRDGSESKGRTEPIRLVYTGRIVREKGLFEAVEALSVLRDRGYFVTLDLIGWTDPSDATIDELLAHARRRGVGDGVQFRGYVSAGRPLVEALGAYDAYVMPGYVPEGFPRALLEAMAAGLPVVATRVGGIPDRLTNGREAVLVQPESPVALADAIQTLIDDRSLREQISTTGQSWASRFTNEASCAAVVRHLRDWIGQPSAEG